MQAKCKQPRSERPVYFGDAKWDQNACKELGFEFVLVGNRFTAGGNQIDNYLAKPSVNNVLRGLNLL